MKPLRLILAFVAGLLAAGGVVAIWEAAVHSALEDEARFAAVALGYGVAAAVGGAVAGVIGARWTAAAVVLALAALAVVNLRAFPHPSWFAVAAAATLAAGLWLGLALARAWKLRRAGT